MDMSFEIELGGGLSFGSSDIRDLAGVEFNFPVSLMLTCSEIKIAENALKLARHAAQVRLNGEKRFQKQRAILERLNGICGCLSALSKVAPLTDDFIEFADRTELDSLIYALSKVKGKTAAELAKKLKMFRA